jgi:hypothetical protein
VKTVTDQQSSLSEVLDKLPVAEQAAFNSSQKEGEPLCFPNTRVEVLDQIVNWFHDVDDARSIFWLNGMAGTGKSTISRTIAPELHDSGNLGASFFFSRGGGDVANSNRFFCDGRKTTRNIKTTNSERANLQSHRAAAGYSSQTQAGSVESPYLPAVVPAQTEICELLDRHRRRCSG